jgi:hypothetical protein
LLRAKRFIALFTVKFLALNNVYVRVFLGRPNIIFQKVIFIQILQIYNFFVTNKRKIFIKVKKSYAFHFATSHLSFGHFIPSMHQSVHQIDNE